MTATIQAPDGTRIVYDVRGSGDTVLVFVHCWSCDREVWREQLDAFDDEYRVVSLDLAGHGESAATRDEWTVLGLAQDVKAVADALGLERMVLIGHSMGGPVSLEAARLMPGRVLGVVAADTLHDADFVFPEEMAEQMTTAFEADFTGTMTNMFSGMAAGEMDPDLRTWIVEKAVGANPDVAIALLLDFANIDFPALFSGAGVPIRAINAAPAPPMIPVTNVEGNRQYADFDAVIVEGSGHFIQLEKPAAFNARLREYIEALAARG
ncbi:MAG: alpha/beta hydrolase [Pseudomonadota bacterium]